MSHESDSMAIALLEEASLVLDISPSQRETVEKSYGAIGAVLAESDSLSNCDPHIQAQGSILLDTVVKPDPDKDFDVDATCLLNCDFKTKSSESIYNLIWDVLQAHGTYGPMCERKNRCIRIDFADNYHVDVTPCVPNEASPLAIHVPDRELRRWKPSNPQLYATMFEDVAKLRPRFRPPLIAVANDGRSKTGGVVDPLPPDAGFRKALLKRIVQCLKRDRDLFFKDRDDAVISVIITTLVSKAYGKLVPLREFDSMLDLLIDVVEDMVNHIKMKDALVAPNYVVENPAIPAENFAEKWNKNPKLVLAFYQWHSRVVENLCALREAVREQKGNHALTNCVSSIHGSDVATLAARNIAERTAEAHRENRLIISPSLSIGTAGVTTKPVRYYGK